MIFLILFLYYIWLSDKTHNLTKQNYENSGIDHTLFSNLQAQAKITSFIALILLFYII